MKNQGQTNDNNNLNDPTVANEPQAQLEFDDLAISGEQEEQVKGGSPASPVLFKNCNAGAHLDPPFKGGIFVGS